MRQYINIPIEELVSDIPVDPLHTRELADSIMSRGQLSPVIAREETKEVIDGFHRIAAMKELGFNEVECVLTPCDDEGFWDFRIIEASTHKNITFARAIDWVEKVFESTPFWERSARSSGPNRYKSAYTLFERARDKTAPQEVQDWALKKAKMWGLSVGTIADWLETRERLQPGLLEEAKRGETPLTHYREIAHTLPTRPELHKPIIEKARREDLSTKEIKTLAQALRRAEDVEEAQSILRQPVSRTEDQMVREAKVEKLLKEPTVTPTPTEKRRELAGRLLEMYMDLQQQVHVIRQLRERERKQLDVLKPSQREELLQVVRDLKAELQWLEDSLGGAVESQVIMERKMIEGR